MSRLATAVLAGVLTAAALPAVAQAPAPPMFATTKVEGTDGVYIFRYQGHQAMFIVTPDGVIATVGLEAEDPSAPSGAADSAAPAATSASPSANSASPSADSAQPASGNQGDAPTAK